MQTNVNRLSEKTQVEVFSDIATIFYLGWALITFAIFCFASINLAVVGLIGHYQYLPLSEINSIIITMGLCAIATYLLFLVKTNGIAERALKIGIVEIILLIVLMYNGKIYTGESSFIPMSFIVLSSTFLIIAIVLEGFKNLISIIDNIQTKRRRIHWNT